MSKLKYWWLTQETPEAGIFQKLEIQNIFKLKSFFLLLVKKDLEVTLQNNTVYLQRNNIL